MAKLKANKPTADVLMNSMRAMGYSFEAAIADIVDNSVSAQARNIVLRFPIDPSDCCVAVCDDGIGMNMCPLKLQVWLGKRRNMFITKGWMKISVDN